jgi:FkbM family methyltransferase
LGAGVKQIIKAILAQTPYRIVRDRGANRFQAIEVTLSGMRDRGFSPGLVIDAGAHLGSFSLAAKQIFPAAQFHLVEPQPACTQPLTALCAREGFTLHACALAERAGRVDMSRADTPNTGVHVQPDGGAETVSVPARTLDGLFADLISRHSRVLLKLDLQGYELHALRGATNVLPHIEAILTEVSFFAQAYEPSVAELLAFLDVAGFQLYDVAALSGRTRDNRLRQGDFVFVRKGSALLKDGQWA